MIRRLALIVALLPAGALAQETPAAPAAPVVPPQQGFEYKAEGRRDPFVSLTRRGVVEAPATPVNRAAGLAGLPVADVSLRGVMASRGEFVGILHGSDNKTYIVRAGQKLLDGTIRVIEKDALVIVQQVNDPLAMEKRIQREVRKALRQDEAK